MTFRIYIELCVFISFAYFITILKDMINYHEVDILGLLIETIGVFGLWPIWFIVFLIKKLEDYLNKM